MGKGSNFFGQPIYGQLIKSLDREKIVEFSRKHGGEKYVKSFDGYTHLLTMLYAVIQRFDSLRTRVRDKKQILLALKKLNRQLEKAADSFGNVADI